MILCPLLAAGCSTMNKSLLTGMGAGAVSGAVVGSNMTKNDRRKGAATGALVGIVLGGITSYFIHKEVEKREQKARRETLFNLDKFDVNTPPGFHPSTAHGLTQPKIESDWVPTRVEGKKLIEGHKVWVITDEPRWIPGSELKRKRKSK